MLKVTVELLPGGDESKAKMIGVMLITNDGTGTADSGNYVAAMMAEYLREPRKGRLTNFNRKTQSCWSLVGGFLKLFGHTNHSPARMGRLPSPPAHHTPEANP